MELFELKTAAKDLKERIERGWACLHPAAIAQEIFELQQKTEDPHFWDTPDTAREIAQRLASLQKKEKLWKSLTSDISGVCELLEMVQENSPELIDMEGEFQQVAQKFETAETALYLSGEYDDRGAVLEINAGAGGTEAQDFAEMLLRMELRFAERMGWKSEILEKSDGLEAGLKCVTVE